MVTVYDMKSITVCTSQLNTLVSKALKQMTTHTNFNVWERGCDCVLKKNLNFFLLKFNIIYIF